MTQQSRRQTTEQQRAAAAWQAVNSVSNNAQKKYATWVRRLAALVQSNGLGSAMAFLLSKAKGDEKAGEGLVFKHVSSWVCNYLNWEDGDLMALVRQANTALYRRATTETIAYATWLKRYVDGLGWGEEET